MKFKDLSNGLICVYIIAAMAFGGMTIYSAVRATPATAGLGAVLTLMLLGTLGYGLYKNCTYLVTDDGIQIYRMKKLLYVLPWDQVKTVGIQKCYKDLLTLYVSRLDMGQTKSIVDIQMRMGGNLSDDVYSINGAVVQKSERKNADKRPILVLSKQADMETFRKVLARQICAAQKAGFPPAKQYVNLKYSEPWPK